MWTKLFETDDSWVTPILRATVGLVMFPHGAQKLFGWFGGHGYHGTMAFFTGTMGIPAPLAFLAIVAELFGAIGLMMGLFTRVAAFGVFCVMTVAVATTHLQNGFFMNWFGNQKGEGFEFHLLVLGMTAALIGSGGGRASVDRWLARRMTSGSAQPIARGRARPLIAS